jgi:hypothetical protein
VEARTIHADTKQTDVETDCCSLWVELPVCWADENYMVIVDLVMLRPLARDRTF